MYKWHPGCRGEKLPEKPEPDVDQEADAANTLAAHIAVQSTHEQNQLSRNPQQKSASECGRNRVASHKLVAK